MPLKSDIVIDASKFLLANVPEDTEKLNIQLAKAFTKGPHYYDEDIGIAKYRELRDEGKTAMPKPQYLPGAKDATVPSREKGRDIPLRVYAPDNGEPSKGVFIHIHGGGFVIGSHKEYDPLLQRYANQSQLTAISVGYRLAPENPHPAPIFDCFDAAEYLVDHAEELYGCKVLFTGGESAGAALTVLTVFHLMRSRPDHQFSGVILPYGYYDLTHNLPQATSFTKPLIINKDDLQRFADAYVPGKSIEERRDPSISALYEDMQALTSKGKKLPPALFLCGTEDVLLDDTLLLSMKWMITGSEAVVKIWPGSPHGFTAFPGVHKAADESAELISQFINEKLES